MSVEGITALPAPWQGYSVDARAGMLDRDAAWHYLSNYAYWGRHRTREIFEQQLNKAFMTFGLFHLAADGTNTMVGMSRIVGDGDTNFLMDVYVLPEHQGRGLGVAFLSVVLDNDGRNRWRWLLHTGDRKDWYVGKLGFSVVGDAGRGKMVGFPIYILERDGLAIEAAQKAGA